MCMRVPGVPVVLASIKNEYNGLCPACRAPYTELSKKNTTIDREDVARRTKQRKQKEKIEKKATVVPKVQPVNRRNLTNVRVMQRNLVYVIGLPVHYADDDMLRSQECFGQYGRIVKAVVNKSHLSTDRNNATASAYITFANKADAQNCIDLIDGYILDGSLLRASFGTTKYCNFFLRNLVCNNPECLYLHELGETDDSFTKEEMATDFVAGKGCFRDLTGYDDRRGTAFPTLSMLQPGGALDKVAPTDAQRKAQSAAAIYKLRSQTPDERKSPTRAPSSSSSSMSPKDEQAATKHRAPPSTSDAPPSASPLSASSASSSSSTSPAKDASKPSLYVNTHPQQSSPPKSMQPDATPLWSQPFPRMQPPPELPSRPIQHVFSPFGMGFDGGIHRNTVQPPPEPAPAPTSNNVSAWTFDAPRPDAPFEFSAVDAAFTPRNESSEALAGLLGVKLSAKPLVPQGIGSGPNGRASRFSFANKDGPGEYSPFGFDAPPPPPTAFGFAHHQPPPPAAEYLHMAPAADASGLAFLQQMLPNVNISYGSDPHRFAEPSMGGGTAWNQDLRPQESTPFWSSQGAFESASGFAAGFQDPAIVNQGAGPGFYHHRDEQSKMQFAYRG
ncbi:hypothetical protein SPRG_05320 [Saprolegnia parasitica CBS 223.65]|uniref:RRM domain-containing protein n=1 Tax=Saprolegnia parasitica (strain CBS 223.65) TaxID=695850 RepID=A0A067CHZ6_SAPPC|nr:hypothetical protein SPRG_05320 [Saprolegnia parasitica CBS 223.65]KDO30128.1 hypothetical protein SPRG_05320 [Saprolegnia parasitica CBS 223.65]|eukprot:XP_012199306.1 hypothetical protein SPRG_05320 [Saprolegnia parasitica CBS 223.65]